MHIFKFRLSVSLSLTPDSPAAFVDDQTASGSLSLLSLFLSFDVHFIFIVEVHPPQRGLHVRGHLLKLFLEIAEAEGPAISGPVSVCVQMLLSEAVMSRRRLWH